MKLIEYARVHNIPFLGLCLGMQCAVIEFARNVAHLEDAHSTEFNSDAQYKIFDLMENQKGVDKGGSMRLGGYECTIADKDSLLYSLYQEHSIIERHRHRYEFNNTYKELLEKHGLIFSGIYMKAELVEAIELPTHPFFIAVQFHPEFLSRPKEPHPLFLGLINKSIEFNK